MHAEIIVLTKFVMIQTAMNSNVTKGIPILANIVIGVDSSKRIFVFSSHVSVACEDGKVTVQIKTLNKKFDSFEKKMKEMQTVIDKKKI